MPRQHDKMLIIQCEDRLITFKDKAETPDDPRLFNDTYTAADRTFALVEAIEMVGEEPRSIAWDDFRFTANDGTILDKQFLNQFMLRYGY